MSIVRLAEGRSIYIMCGRTDLRKQIDGLCQEVRGKYALDPCSNALFLFCGRRADRFKALFFDEERGFVLVYVRLAAGRFKWPRTPEEAREIDQEQYRRLLNGLQILEKSSLVPFHKEDLI